MDQLLAAFGVKQIVVGHTPTPGAVVPRHGGKVPVIDAGLSAHYGNHPLCLVQEGDTTSRCTAARRSWPSSRDFRVWQALGAYRAGAGQEVIALPEPRSDARGI